MTDTEIVAKFLAGFNDPSQLQKAIALLDDNYKFKDPTVEHNSKAEFLVTAQELGKVLTGVEILRMAKNEEWVVVMYNFKSSIKGLENNFGTEWFKVKNGKIVESQLIYDATEWRKVFAQLAE